MSLGHRPRNQIAFGTSAESAFQREVAPHGASIERTGAGTESRHQRYGFSIKTRGVAPGFGLNLHLWR
jgi:hypothetical protein